MRTVIGAFLFLIGIPPALAQSDVVLRDFTPPPGKTTNDGRATAQAAVLAVFAEAQARPGRVLQPGDAARIRDIMMADGKLSDAEFDLLDELAAWSIRNINISPEKGDGAKIVTGTTSGATRKVFDDMFAAHYAAAWNDQDKARGWAELLRQSRFSDTAWRRVVAFLTTMTLPAAQGSTAANTYKPTVDLVIELNKRNKALPEEGQAAGKKLCYDAFANADQQVRDELPDFTYNWLAK